MNVNNGYNGRTSSARGIVPYSGPQDQRGRVFSVTINKGSRAERLIELDQLTPLFQDNSDLVQDRTITIPHARYGLGQLEVGHNDGNLHIQLYLEFDSVRTSSAVQKFVTEVLGGRTQVRVYIGRFEKQRNKEMRTYASKQRSRAPGTSPWEFQYQEDDAPDARALEPEEVEDIHNGARRDRGERDGSSNSNPVQQEQGLKAGVINRAFLVNEITNGARLSEISRKYPNQYAIFPRELQAARAVWLSNQPQERNKKVVFCLWGKTGTGKTSATDAFLNYYNLGRDDFFHVKATRTGTLWFDGYDGQKIIIFDDFNSNVMLQDILHLTDFNAGQHQFEVKFGKVRLLHRIVIFTSNKSPTTEWYDNEPDESRQAVLRRLTFKLRFSDDRDPEATARSMSAHIKAQDPELWKYYEDKRMEDGEVDLDNLPPPNFETPMKTQGSLNPLLAPRPELSTKPFALATQPIKFPPLDNLSDEEEEEDSEGTSITSSKCASSDEDEEDAKLYSAGQEGRNELFQDFMKSGIPVVLDPTAIWKFDMNQAIKLAFQPTCVNYFQTSLLGPFEQKNGEERAIMELERINGFSRSYYPHWHWFRKDRLDAMIVRMYGLQAKISKFNEHLLDHCEEILEKTSWQIPHAIFRTLMTKHNRPFMGNTKDELIEFQGALLARDEFPPMGLSYAETASQPLPVPTLERTDNTELEITQVIETDI